MKAQKTRGRKVGTGKQVEDKRGREPGGCTAIMHVGAGLSGSGSCICAATELYLETPVINGAGAAFCMEEVDEG
ncbi:hypothetical protein JOQ06_004245 [Pogonophryne albipinna]|uniref:Uncharacterized protein n=1 Tax=Pogonophryne albipinna TaxID=1090488 RepID=A0AAD6AQQ6_9TELE|nr:hypothetical protein JOQ06_004245 [Pogonophryne albipinna]